MGADETVGSHVSWLLPAPDGSTVRRLERAARRQTFSRRDVLHFGACDCLHSSCSTGTSWLAASRRPAGSRRIDRGPEYLGGLRSISDPGAEALYGWPP